MYDGLLAMRGKRYEVALERFDALVKHDADFAEGWNKRATVLYLLGRYEESIADIKQVLALEKRHFGAPKWRFSNASTCLISAIDSS